MTSKTEDFTRALGACLATTTSANRKTLAAAYNALPSRLIKSQFLDALFAAIEDACLVLLRHNARDLPRTIFRAQHGHLGRRLARATVNRRRKVAIESGM